MLVSPKLVSTTQEVTPHSLRALLSFDRSGQELTEISIGKERNLPFFFYPLGADRTESLLLPGSPCEIVFCLAFIRHSWTPSVRFPDFFRFFDFYYIRAEYNCL